MKNCLRCGEKARDEICDDCLREHGIEIERGTSARDYLVYSGAFICAFFLLYGAYGHSCSSNLFYFTCTHADGVKERAYPWAYEELQRDPDSCFFKWRAFLADLPDQLVEEDIVVPEKTQKISFRRFGKR